MLEQRPAMATAEVERVQKQLSDAPPSEVIAWALGRFGDRIAFVTSFQRTGVVGIDMAYRMGRRIRIVTIDTGRLPEETHEFMAAVRSRYPLAELQVIEPQPGEVDVMTSRHGRDLFYDGVHQRLLCCHVRKVRPLARALTGLAAWVTGTRRDQGPLRADLGLIEVDSEHEGLVKINPFASWTSEQVEQYVREYDVPVHPLYEQGFASIGCAPCTRPTRAGEDPRAGRWWWEEAALKECGIHHRVADVGLKREISTIVELAQMSDPEKERALRISS